MEEEKQTLATQCFDKISESILSGEFRPGEKLLCEELKKRYQVGMSAIREALSKLASTQLVSFEERKGFSVAKLSADEIKDHIRSFFAIESLCLQQSISAGDDSWEGQVVAALHALKKIEQASKSDFFQWNPVNKRFHDILVSACPLRTLLEIRNQLYQKHQWYIFLSYKFADSSLIAPNHLEHVALAEAVIAKKIPEAIELMHHHVESGIDDLIHKLSHLGLIYGTS